MSYELDLFSRMEVAFVDGKPISELTIHDNSPLWHRFSQSIFDGDIKRFARTKSFSEYSKEFKSFKKNLFRALVVFKFIGVITLLCTVNVFFKKPKVLIYSVDKNSDPKTKSDFRLHRVYKTLKNNKISYVECFHTLIEKRTISNYLSRKRLAIYMEAIDGFWYVGRFFLKYFKKKDIVEINGLEGTEDEILFMKVTIKKYLAIKRLLKFRKDVLKKILKISGIKALVGIDDVRHYHELLEACRELNIPSIVVQHGHFTKYHVGWLKRNVYEGKKYQKANKILVWSEYWSDELVRLNSVYENKDIVVSGYPNQTSSVNFVPKKDKKIVILIPHETEGPKEEIFKYIKELSKLEDTVLYFKIRPDVSEDVQLKTYPEDIKKYANVVKDLHEVPKPDFVSGVYSTFLYDMALLGIPVLIMNTSMDYGGGMIKNEMANQISIDTLGEDLKNALNLPKTVTQDRVIRLQSKNDFHEALLGELKLLKVI